MPDIKIPNFEIELEKLRKLTTSEVDKQINIFGKQMLEATRLKAPKKTGNFARNLKGRLKDEGDATKIYQVYPSGAKKNNLIWGILENGTGKRFRTYKEKAREIKFREQKSTGKFGEKANIQKKFFSNIEEEYNKKFSEKLAQEIQKKGG